MESGPALALSTVLIGLAAAMRAATGTWLHPGSFFTVWWCFTGILPLLLAPREPVAPHAVVWLIAASIAVSAGAIVGNGGFKTRRLHSIPAVSKSELSILGLALVLAIIFGMGSNIAFMKEMSIAFSDVIDIEKLVVASQQAYAQKYAEPGTAPVPVVAQVLLPFVYLAPALGGIVFVLRREKLWRLLAVMSLMPAVSVTILQTTKAAILFAISCWLSGYFATRVRFGQLRVFTRGHLLVAAVFGTVLTVFFFFASFARLASTDLGLIDLVIVKLVTAAFGHMTVFSQWLAEYWHDGLDPSLGTITFAGPLELLGFGQRVPGLFDSLVELVAGQTSNVYTGFRPLIQDWTIPGALAILAVLGFMGGVGFRMITGGQWSGAFYLIATYVTIYWTPITWFWVYNSLTAAVVGVGLILFFVRLWRGRRHAPIQGEHFVGTA